MSSLSGSDDPSQRFMELLAGKWVVQAVSAAAELGLGDALDAPASASVLASKLHCDPEALARLLAVLAAENLLEEVDPGVYALTDLGRCLRGDALRDLARFVGSKSQWLAWAHLPDAVRTGRSGFSHAHGASLFDYLAAHPDEARAYDAGVDTFTRQQARALAASGRIAGQGTVVDVGGGRGTLLLELLACRPELRGVLVDRPDVVEAAKARFEAAGLVPRCRFVGEDFMQRLPEGGDTYVVKHVLHNWDDERAVGLLRRCRAALAPGGQVVVVEAILLPIGHRDLARWMDLEMLVLTGGGKERSKPQFRRLFANAGLKLRRTQALAAGVWALIGTA